VTSYLATVITNSPRAIEEAVRGIAAACDRDPDAAAGIAGIHLEGPFLSAEDGPRGAHEKRFIRPPDFGLVRRWQEASGGRVRLITMSPEHRGSAGFIRRCVASGIAVAIGHTAATPEQVREAAAAGATLSTHLGNGAHLRLARHPNYLWEQLADDRLRACFIADGFHLPDSVMKVILRAKGERACLVSDAVYLAGLPPGEYETHIGGRVVLTRKGRLQVASNPKLLAGSAQMILRGMERLIRSGLTSFAEAWDLASTRAASALGLSARKGLAPGAPGDLVVLKERGGSIEVLETWKAGRKVHEA
jgi:N-acetylglucosamine-6-phosphate deacetylase